MGSGIQGSNTDPTANVGEADIVAALMQRESYPNERPDGHSDAGVEMVETHISRVFLSGKHAYKVKKPLANAFLDYSTLAKRQHYCLKELQLDRRYAPRLYVDVVPITVAGGKLEMDGRGAVVDYAVQMKRFAPAALLSQRLACHSVTAPQIEQLAARIAEFHRDAAVADPFSEFGSPERIGQDALDNLRTVSEVTTRFEEPIQRLTQWTEQQFARLRNTFADRQESGHIRECHGDLHAENVVFLDDQFVPFDGIEFNEHFRWIDVCSDLGFLAMDMAARSHQRHGNLLVSSYLECSGDYEALRLLKWYQVYRALVRAKVASLRANQLDVSDRRHEEAISRVEKFFAQALEYTKPPTPRLWITHGFSGSGKSTGAQQIVRDEGAIRIRSDVERKRLHGIRAEHHPSAAEAKRVYSDEATNATYCRLRQLAREILCAGYSVVVDATFLAREYRESLSELASDQGVAFEILHFDVPESILRTRIANRAATGNDASDAGIAVLEQQLNHVEPLTASERGKARVMSDLGTV